jgi:hypothetical protein
LFNEDEVIFDVGKIIAKALTVVVLPCDRVITIDVERVTKLAII